MGKRKELKEVISNLVYDLKFTAKYFNEFTKEERHLMETIRQYDIPIHVIRYYKENVFGKQLISIKQCQARIKRNIILSKSCKSFTDSNLEFFHYGALTMRVNHRTHEIDDIQNIKGKFGLHIEVDKRKKELLNMYFGVK